ncbi:hypothetical protein [Luteibacter sp. CQ10]|uniref:hypothetical protein n=1 Tax=Luteibacter sp. CQ10 TaxID=2805821 RepID=UPI0034A5C693
MNPLKEFDFSVLGDLQIDESVVREEIIAPLLRAMGYSVQGPSRMIRHKALTHPYVMLGSVRKKVNIIPDYVLEPEGGQRWILEAKSPHENILAGDNPAQAFSYAIHPDIRAFQYALCNGRQFVLFAVNTLTPQVVDLDGSEGAWGRLTQLLRPLHGKVPARSNYRPDLGLYLLKAGYAPDIRVSFHPMGLPSLAMMKPGLYTAFVDIQVGDEWYASSFDFGAERLAELLQAVSPAQASRINRALGSQPFKVDFETDIPVVNIDATLGPRIIASEKETYLPLSVISFASAGVP